MSEQVMPSLRPGRHDVWLIGICYVIAVGVLGLMLFYAMYQSFTFAQFGLSLAVLVVVITLLRWLRADRRGYALAIVLTVIGSFGVLFWVNSRVTVFANLDAISGHLCHVRPGGLVSVTVYTDHDKPIAYASSHDSKGISDSYYTEYFDQQGKLVCVQAAFSTDAQDKCAVMMKARVPSVDITTVAEREVCGNFPI